MGDGQGRSATQMAGRVMFTLLGAAALIAGGFMEWVRGIDGVRLRYTALYDRPFEATSAFIPTVGFVLIALGIVAVIGLATSGWLTRLAGALGIVVFILLVIQLYQGGTLLPGLGPWLVLSGGIVAVVGGG